MIEVVHLAKVNGHTQKRCQQAQFFSAVDSGTIKTVHCQAVLVTNLSEIEPRTQHIHLAVLFTTGDLFPDPVRQRQHEIL